MDNNTIHFEESPLPMNSWSRTFDIFPVRHCYSSSFMMRKNATKQAAHRYIRRLQELRRDKVEHEGRAALHGLDDAMKKALDLLQMNCSAIPDDEKTLKELVTYFQQQVAVCEPAKFVCVICRHVSKLTNLAGAAGAGRCPGSSSDRPTAHGSVANETEGSGG
jgi:hypothetical protein